jgi:hypothetical protein
VRGRGEEDGSAVGWVEGRVSFVADRIRKVNAALRGRKIHMGARMSVGLGIYSWPIASGR